MLLTQAVHLGLRRNVRLTGSVAPGSRVNVGRNAVRLKDAKNALRQHDMVLERGKGEYSVNFVGGEAGTAYNTKDLEDAVKTGISMRRWKTASNWPTPQSLA
jgi:hypothetical protein